MAAPPQVPEAPSGFAGLKSRVLRLRAYELLIFAVLFVLLALCLASAPLLAPRPLEGPRPGPPGHGHK